jgi:hypothetical protein
VTGRAATRLPERWVAVAAGAAITLLFAGVRGALLLVREPFFDELYTLWISARPLAAQWSALLNDSGPPLYYALVRAITLGHPALTEVRLLSMAAAVALLTTFFFARSLGPARWIAALLLAVFPAHVYFSTEARSYALAALCAGIAALAIDAWLTSGRRMALGVAVVAMLAAAWCHYYGVLFFPVPLVAAAVARRKRAAIEGLVAGAIAGIGFLPGFWLALRQPPEAMRWLSLGGGSYSAWEPLLHLSWAAPYPAVFIVPPPLAIQIFALALTAVAVVAGFREERPRIWGAITLTPVALAMLFSAAGMAVYFPTRFEAVIAAPLAVWIALSLGTIRDRRVRGTLLVCLLVVGAVSSYYAFMTAAGKPRDGWRETALLVRRSVPPTVPVVASGYAYLELTAQRSEEWPALVAPFPASLGDHPGWAGAADALTLTRERLPEESFVWVGEWESAERRELERRYAVRVLERVDRIVVVEAREKREPHSGGVPEGSRQSSEAKIAG